MKENKTEIKKELEGEALQDNELEGITGGVFEPAFVVGEHKDNRGMRYDNKINKKELKDKKDWVVTA